MPEVEENEVENLLKELDEAIMLITIARAQRRLMFVKGVVRYAKSMAPKTVKEAFEEVKR